MEMDTSAKEDDLDKTPLSIEPCEQSCDNAEEELLYSPDWPPQESPQSLGRVHGMEDEHGGEEDEEEATVQTSASTSSDTSSSMMTTDSPPRKYVRFAATQLPSPSERYNDSDTYLLIPDDVSVNSTDSHTTSDDHGTIRPAGKLKKEDDEEISFCNALLDTSADPQQDFCMSGALPPDYVYSAHHRLQAVLNDDDDSLVCSSDLNLLVAKMPFRLVSKDEFDDDWADSFFRNPFLTLRQLPNRFFTTPLGIARAKCLSDKWINELCSRYRQELIEDCNARCEDVNHRTCSCEADVERGSVLPDREFDRERIEALLYFSGEFARYAGYCVKYPEYLQPYWRNWQGFNDPDGQFAARQYWGELYAKGNEFWDAQWAGEAEADAIMYGHLEEEKNVQVETDSDETQSKEKQDSMITEGNEVNGCDEDVKAKGTEERNT